MAGVAVIGWAILTILALKDGDFDWGRYTFILGTIVLGCALSWGLSALIAIAHQTSRRRLSRGAIRDDKTRPWGRRTGGEVVRLPERGSVGQVMPSLPLLAGAVVVGAIGSFFLFNMPSGGGDGAGVNVYRGGEVAQFGRSNGGKTSKTTIGRAGGGDYSLCNSIIRRSCVIDGDTIRHGWTKIRIADIDTPEISEPKCASEAALGHRAKERLLELLNDGPFEIVHPGGRDEDVYGRKLRVITRDGRSLGMILVDEGLARRWTGSRRSWCI